MYKNNSSFPPLHGNIDGTSPEGFIFGWAWRAGTLERCHVRVLSDGRPVAEALADRFRRDLLEAGIGLGFCGFVARAQKPLAPGPHLLQLLEAKTETPIGREVRIEIPASAAEKTANARLALPHPQTIWSDEDVLAHLAQFNLAAHHRRMGTLRFIDVTFRYVLGRWADEVGLNAYARELDSGALSPEQFFAALLRSKERKANPKPLPSPFDYRFPFTAPPALAAPR